MHAKIILQYIVIFPLTTMLFSVIIFTGGDAIYFEKRVKFPNFADSNLLLVGLNKILNTNE